MLRRACRWVEAEVNEVEEVEEVKESDAGRGGCTAADLGGWLMS